MMNSPVELLAFDEASGRCRAAAPAGHEIKCRTRSSEPGEGRMKPGKTLTYARVRVRTQLQ